MLLCRHPNTVANVARLTMRGGSSSGNRATVVCSESVGLSFTNVVEFKIHSLAFTSCSRRYALILPPFPPIFVCAVLHLQSYTQHTELVNCSFHDNMATALVVNSTNITLSGNIEFKRNRPCSNMIAGGGIIASDSNLTFTGNTTFLDNSAIFEQCPFGFPLFSTAVVTANNTVLSFNGVSNFINNSGSGGNGGGGGAIYT